MRSQDRTGRLTLGKGWVLAALSAAVIATSAMAQMVPQLSGPQGDAMQTLPADPLPKWIIDDIRRMRAYPEQPPIIPHSIDGYQLSVNANRCLSCHKREFSPNAGAPMISVTHYMDREGQMLADVSPRRYFCTACHVPHEWADKIARKMQASKEVWGKIFGTINTREKFLNHRLELAKHEWARLKANDSLECRNYHSAVAMDFTKQTQRAADIHSKYLLPGKATCIDCHKGIAHELPNMEGVDRAGRCRGNLKARSCPLRRTMRSATFARPLPAPMVRAGSDLQDLVLNLGAAADRVRRGL